MHAAGVELQMHNVSQAFKKFFDPVSDDFIAVPVHMWPSWLHPAVHHMDLQQHLNINPQTGWSNKLSTLMQSRAMQRHELIKAYL
jgi:hypothetical protein